MSEVTDLIDILNNKLEPGVRQGVGNDMMLMSMAISLKRIADWMETPAPAPVPQPCSSADMYLSQIAKAITAIARGEGSQLPRIY
jgi:hypothetical protein